MSDEEVKEEVSAEPAIELPEVTESVDPEVLQDAVAEQVGLKEEVKEKELNDFEKYAVTKGWDPKGSKPALDWMSYWERKNLNIIKASKQTIDLLTAKLAEKEQSNYKVYLKQIEDAMDEAAQNGNPEAYTVWKQKYKEVSEQASSQSQDYQKTVVSDRDVAVREFADRNRELLAKKEVYDWTQNKINELATKFPSLPAEEILDLTEKELHSTHKVKSDPAPILKTLPVSRTGSSKKELTEDSLYPENLSTYQFLKKKDPKYTIKTFVSDMKKVSKTFKVRGE